MNWSSGKDAALAFHLIKQQNIYEMSLLFTSCTNGVSEKLSCFLPKFALNGYLQKAGACSNTKQTQQ